MTQRFVITDDSTNKEVPTGHEYYEVRVWNRGTPAAFKHYASWGGVIDAIKALGGSEEVTIKRNVQY